MSQSIESMKDKIFSFSDIRSSLSSPIASTSGKIKVNSFNVHPRSHNQRISGQNFQTSQGQIVSLNNAETNYHGIVSNPSSIYMEEYISENLLVQDLIYSFQGIEGKILKLDSNYGFQIDPTININRSHKQIVLRLSELGYLHNVITRGLERISVAGAGRVADSFAATLHKELSEYYRFIAIMQEEFNR